MLIHITDKPHEVTDRKYIDSKGVLRQVTACYHIAAGAAHLFWEWISGWLFTEDGYSLKTEDDYTLKCNDQ